MKNNLLKIFIATALSALALSAEAGTKIACKQKESAFDITIESERNLPIRSMNTREYPVQVTHGYLTRGHWSKLATDKISGINTRVMVGVGHYIKLGNGNAFIQLEEINYSPIGGVYFVGLYNNGFSASQLICERIEN